MAQNVVVSGPSLVPVAPKPVQQKTAAVPEGRLAEGKGKQAVVPSTPFPHVKEPNLQLHYDDLLKVIAEIGKDIKPAYTNNKMSSDRLKRNIGVARGVLRDCMSDVEKLHQMHLEK